MKKQLKNTAKNQQQPGQKKAAKTEHSQKSCCSSMAEEPLHGHKESNQTIFQMFIPSILSFTLLLLAIGFDIYFRQSWFTNWIRLFCYGLAYITIGFPVIRQAVLSIRKGEIFSEFLLMSIATIGAFCINEYPEAVAVMLFYAIGEIFQSQAVQKARRNIKLLLDQRPDTATVVINKQFFKKKAAEISIGERIHLLPGEKLALDGTLRSENALLNTAALTGESRPRRISQGESILAGMINLNKPVQVEVTTAYQDSKLSKILEMVQQASSRKAPTELFIRKFAKIYTPIVVFLAILITVLPLFWNENYVFKEGLYRALIFLVISCPCALVISIPLGYFGGIGAACKNGLLFKGSGFLDLMAKVQTIVLDKTGTLTQGVFKVQKVEAVGISQADLLRYTAALETQSTHPIAAAIIAYAGSIDQSIELTAVEEISGLGLKATIEENEILAGNAKLMEKHAIQYDHQLNRTAHTVIIVAINSKYAGYFMIADQLKEDSKTAIEGLHRLGVQTLMLSGDKQTVVDAVAKELNIAQAYGNLLPEEKVEKVEQLKAQNLKLAFVGDGVNDAPVIALADIGIAMGGLGSDATIETADLVIQNDQPSKLVTAINISRKTKQIVYQNIALAFAVKAIVLLLGAGGLATMWEAVFADVGVALLAILNAIRIQRMNFN